MKIYTARNLSEVNTTKRMEILVKHNWWSSPDWESWYCENDYWYRYPDGYCVYDYLEKHKLHSVWNAHVFSMKHKEKNEN